MEKGLIRTEHVPVMRSMVSVDALARLLETAYGLVGVGCQLIKGTIRDTYRVVSRSGSYVLSIYRHNQRTVAEIAAELDLIAYLDARRVAVAPAVAMVSGECLLPVPAPEGVRYAVLFEYIDGAQLSKEPDPMSVRRYGRAIAKIHTLSDALPRPLPRPRIDIEAMLDRPLAAFATVVTHRPDDLEYLREVAGILRSGIADLPSDAPAFGLIHGDVIPSNAQVTPRGEVAVLDFDFCGYGWRAYDVATYLNEVAFWNTPLEAARAFLDGYQEVRQLADWERAALPLFQAARGIASLGTPALNVNEWGSAYLSDRMIDTQLAGIRQSMERILSDGSGSATPTGQPERGY